MALHAIIFASHGLQEHCIALHIAASAFNWAICVVHPVLDTLFTLLYKTLLYLLIFLCPAISRLRAGVLTSLRFSADLGPWGPHPPIVAEMQTLAAAVLTWGAGVLTWERRGADSRRWGG